METTKAERGVPARPVPEFDTKLRYGKWRTVDASTGRPAVNSKTGNPIDGGGWPNTFKGHKTAVRQVGHLAEWEPKPRRK